MSKTELVKMRTSLVCAGLLLAAAGTAAAQDFPKVETAPGFMYIKTQPLFGGSKAGGCAGIGGTIAYNVSSVFGLAADLGTCKIFGLNNDFGLGSKVSGNESTFMFGPRFTLRNKSPFRPFFELNVGAVRAKASCDNGNFGNACNTTTVNPLIVVPNPNATSASKTAFGMSVGGGFDVQLSKKLSWRVVQAEYLYTRFGNDCQLAYCSNNNNQNSFRLKSALVVAWGGERPEPPPPPAPAMKPCPGGASVSVGQECPKQNITLGLSGPQTELCQGAVATIAPSAGIPGNATYQWTVNGQPISQAASMDFGTTGRDPGTYKVGLTVGAEGYNDATAETAVTVRAYRAPTGTVEVSPSEISVGDKATLAANFTPGQCGGALGAPVFSASDGSVTGNVFDSSGVQFDPSSNKEQRKTVTIVAKVSDGKGGGEAQAAVVVKRKAMAKRLPDIIFPVGKSRVNNCGKRVLLEELKPYLDGDPTGRVVLVGHIHEKESGVAGLDQKRALNAAAVISSGQGVCSSFAAAQILVGAAGSTDTGADYQAYFCGTSTVPRTEEIAAYLVNENDVDAKYRRVEVWFVPTGGEPPAFLKGYQDAASLSVASLGCPK